MSGLAATEPRPAAPDSLPARVLGACFARLFLLQALWNYERMQGIGFAYAVAPVAREVSGDDAEAAKSLVGQAAYFNTHPVMASVAVGVVARETVRRSRGEEAMDDAALARVKQLLSSALAAVGDALFWSTTRPLLGLAAVYVWREDRSALGIASLLVGYNVLAVGFRARGLIEGYRRGLAYVADLPARIGRLTQLVRLLGVVMAALVLSTVLVPAGHATPWAAIGGLAGAVAGGVLFGSVRLGSAGWGAVLVLCALAWVTVGPGF